MLLIYDYYDLAEASAARALAGRPWIGGRLPVTPPGCLTGAGDLVLGRRE
ncbi:MAG: hypothetical protein R2752_02985 [Vicinamibacterales bacterium]